MGGPQEQDSVAPTTTNTHWARGVLMERGIDPSAHPVRALRALRKADRRLSLGSARYLADAAAGRPQRRGHTRSPFLE
ncbi:hypothetical protein [Brachybacterium muris]|uniref:hypothetical protein n=1 Tax=Brachybacterium muris TaxID=219301 RepID=UPI0035E59056